MTTELSPAATASAACPYHSAGAAYQPLSEAHVADHHRVYDRLRGEEPVFFSPLLNSWVLTRYEDVSMALRDHRRFSSAGSFQGSVYYTPQTQALLSQGAPFLINAMINNDPPRHTQIRSSVARVFSAQRVASFEPRIRALVGAMIDELLPAGKADIVQRFNYRMPAAVIYDIIGVPPTDFEEVARWCQDTIVLLTTPLPAEQQLSCAQSMLAYQRYLLALIAERRSAPRDDLVSDLIQSIDRGESELSMDDLVELLFDLVVAGHETTANLLGTCLAQVLPDRALWAALSNDPALLRNVIEEAIRFDGPAIGFFRIVREDVTVGGVTIPQGSTAFLLYTSANHDDEGQFPNPERFDPQRVNAGRHLGFGAGIHFCLGASLARLEMRIALEELRSRMPSLRLVAGQQLTYRPLLTVRGLEQLLVEWDSPQPA